MIRRIFPELPSNRGVPSYPSLFSPATIAPNLEVSPSRVTLEDESELLLPTTRRILSKLEGHVNTISRTSTWISHVTRWWSSQGFPVRVRSSLAFGTLYAEAQRRYLESVSPHARSLFRQLTVPDVDSINGLPPAIALQQQRGSPTTRSSVGSITTLSNILRMLYSRAGDYPRGQEIIYAEGFSPNTPEGACPNCHGLGRV